MASDKTSNPGNKKDLQNELAINVHQAIIGAQHLSEGEDMNQNNNPGLDKKPEVETKKSAIESSGTNSTGKDE